MIKICPIPAIHIMTGYTFGRESRTSMFFLIIGLMAGVTVFIILSIKYRFHGWYLMT